MKKAVILLVICLSHKNFFAQSTNDKLFKKLCECISLAIDKTTGINDEKFQSCWSNDSNFLKELKPLFDGNDTLISDEQGYNFGKEFFEKNQAKFIHQCDAFYHFLDSSRYDFFAEVNPEKVKKQIDSTTLELNKNNKDPELFRIRGLAFFSLLKLKEAKSDFDKALELPNADIQCLYFRGWTLEISGNYDEAIADYKLAKQLSGIPYLDSIIAIAERKKKEKK